MEQNNKKQYFRSNTKEIIERRKLKPVKEAKNYEIYKIVSMFDKSKCGYVKVYKKEDLYEDLAKGEI